VGEDLSPLLPCNGGVPGGEQGGHLNLPVVEAAVRMNVRWVRICLLSSPLAAVSQVERRAGTPQPTCGGGSCEDECKVGEDLSPLLPCSGGVQGGEEGGNTSAYLW
jgi:hypothetical protein